MTPATAGGTFRTMATRATKATPKRKASTKPAQATRKTARGGGSGAGQLRPAPEGDRMPDSLARLEASHEALRAALQEVPKAADFQPLADHLYEFARIAPTLSERLGDFASIVETLQALHGALSEAVSLVPRAEEYEPLAEPLRRFARAAPALVASLDEVVSTTRPLAGPLREFATVAPALGERLAEVARSAGPLAESVKRLQGLDAAIARLERLAGASAADALAGMPPLGDTPDQVARARALIIEALESLPRREEYAPAAAQLREIASVSPTLLDWMAEVPRLSAPLRDSIERLYEATALLGEVEQRLIAATRGQ